MSFDDDPALAFDWTTAERELMCGVDISVPHSARIWDYWLGGKDNFPIDRRIGDQVATAYPGIGDLARACRYFSARVVRTLAGVARVRQFLDIGTGFPGADNTHEVAQRVAPDARIVYVDNDALVLGHARALLVSGPDGGCDYIEADLADPNTIVTAAEDLLDFSRPVAILLMSALRHIGVSDADDTAARAIVRHLVGALPSGGYLAVCDTEATDPDLTAAMALYNAACPVPWHLRRRRDIARFFDDLEVLEPGIVPIQRWRPDPSPFSHIPVAAYGGVGRKP